VLIALIIIPPAVLWLLVGHYSAVIVGRQSRRECYWLTAAFNFAARRDGDHDDNGRNAQLE
jgi:hypothetical protein